MLTLVTDFAQAYYELLELDVELDVAHQLTDAFGETYKLFDERLQGGVSSKLDTSRVAGVLDTDGASLTEIEREIALQENQDQCAAGFQLWPDSTHREAARPDLAARGLRGMAFRFAGAANGRARGRATGARSQRTSWCCHSEFLPLDRAHRVLGRASAPLSVFGTIPVNSANCPPARVAGKFQPLTLR